MNIESNTTIELIDTKSVRPNIAEMADGVDKALAELADRIDRLRSRLESVTAGNFDGYDVPCDPTPDASVLWLRMAGQVARIHELTRIVDDLGDRVEL